MLATTDFDGFDSDGNLLDLDSAEPRIGQRKQRSPSPSIFMPSPPPPLLAKEETIEEEESQWGSANQLGAAREISVVVGEEYLKYQGIRLGKFHAAPKLEIKDWEAHEMYIQGVKDAKSMSEG